MVRDREQIEKLVLLLAPILLMWFAFTTLFAYEMGKNGIEHIDWIWIVQSNIPAVIISASLLYYRKRKYTKK